MPQVSLYSGLPGQQFNVRHKKKRGGMSRMTLRFLARESRRMRMLFQLRPEIQNESQFESHHMR